MESIVKVGKHYIACERIALVEGFIAPTDPPLNSPKEFKSRIVLLDRVSILSEQSPEDFANEHSFRFLIADQVALSPTLVYRIERFEPTDDFKPAKPYQSRLLWTAPNGTSNSKLLLASPEKALAIAVRGEADDDAEASPEGAAPERPARQVRRARAERQSRQG